jgi:hypothetical protein
MADSNELESLTFISWLFQRRILYQGRYLHTKWNVIELSEVASYKQSCQFETVNPSGSRNKPFSTSIDAYFGDNMREACL